MSFLFLFSFAEAKQKANKNRSQEFFINANTYIYMPVNWHTCWLVSCVCWYLYSNVVMDQRRKEVKERNLFFVCRHHLHFDVLTMNCIEGMRLLTSDSEKTKKEQYTESCKRIFLLLNIVFCFESQRSNAQQGSYIWVCVKSGLKNIRINISQLYFESN